MLNTNYTYRLSAKMQLRYHFFFFFTKYCLVALKIYKENQKNILIKSIIFPYDSIIHSVQLRKRYVPFCVLENNLHQLCVYDTKIKRNLKRFKLYYIHLWGTSVLWLALLPRLRAGEFWGLSHISGNRAPEVRQYLRDPLRQLLMSGQ